MKNFIKTFSLLLLSCLMLGCISCGVQPGRESTEDTENTEETIDIDSIASLSLKASIPENYPESLSMYHLTYWVPDESILVPLYMKNEPNKVEDWAGGKTFYYYEKEECIEYMNIYSNVIHGGFGYGKDASGNMQSLATKAVDVPNNTAVDPVNEQYLSFTDQSLSFADKEEVIRAIGEYMEKGQFPEVRVRHFFSRDKDTLNYNIALYNQFEKEISGEDYEPFVEVFSDKDEDYLIKYEQMIDSVPLTTIPLFIGMETTGRTTNTEIQFIWDSEGLNMVECQNMFNVGDKIRDVKIISPEKALSVYAEDYDKALHIDETVITGVELNYAAMWFPGNDSITAKPVWIISTTTMKTSPHPNPQNDSLVLTPKYAVCAIDAETGKILESMYLDEE